MAKAKEIKGVVLCENFNKQFIDLIKKLEYPPELEKYLKYFESEDVTNLSVNLFNSDDFGKLALCDFEVFTSGFDSYSYHIHFNFDDDVRIIIIDRLNNYNILLDVSLQLNGFKWGYLFILPNSYAVELTTLERVVFEEIENCYERYNEYSELAKVAEYGAEYNGESTEEIVRYGHLANEQIFNSDYLKELISKAGLQETYQAWLAKRKKQEAVGASK